jgi:UMF1 family MFS transporter
MLKIRKQTLSWAMYDWANSAFATVVMAGFFPVVFKEYWNAGVEATESTFRLGLANSLASLLIVIISPFLGAIADSLGRRKAMLLAFAWLGILMTGGLYLVQGGQWEVAALLYVLGLIGFSGANIFYDALLPFIARESEYDMLSALGFSLGYLGGGLMLGLNVLLVKNPELLGFADTETVIRLSFLMVAAWWALFSLPLWLFVEEPEKNGTSEVGKGVLEGFRQVWRTLHEIRQLRNVWMFLLAYWLYIDGVDTIVRMAVDYGLSLGFEQGSLIMALLLTQFVGFPAALAFGYLGNRYGPRAGIFVALGVYIFVTVRAAVMTSESEFYFLAFMIGLAQGGIQALSRSLFARMIPENRSAEFFGFYNMLGKFAAILGPLMVGWIGVLAGNARVGILSLIIMFLLGGILLKKAVAETE